MLEMFTARMFSFASLAIRERLMANWAKIVLIFTGVLNTNILAVTVYSIGV